MSNIQKHFNRNIQKSTLYKCIVFAVIIISILFSFYGYIPINNSAPTPSQIDDQEFAHSRPPLIFVQDTKFMIDKVRTIEELGIDFINDCIYLGDITSSIPSHLSPTENFQANTDIVGAHLYKSYNGIIAVYNVYYEIYSPID